MLNIKSILKNRFFPDKPMEIRNLGYDGTESQPRVLFTYLTDAFNSENSDFTFVSNRKECQMMVTTLLKLGFCVDVVDCRHNFQDSDMSYDFVFGFGQHYRHAKLNPDGKRILYLTEAPPKVSFQAETERCKYFQQRHNKAINLERSGSYYQDVDVDLADQVICLGEQNRDSLVKLYQKNAIDIYPVGIPLDAIKKEFTPSKQLLWFGSRGIVHKGLDILIDAFANMPDWTLHVCGATSEDVKDLMPLTENIKFYGRISVNEPLFERLIQKCNFSILLSCSEGVSTSVITTMKAGLIPIVGSNCGIYSEGSVIVDAIDIPNVMKVIEGTYEHQESNLKNQSEQIKSYANSVYTPINFIEKFNQAFQTIMSEK